MSDKKKDRSFFIKFSLFVLFDSFILAICYENLQINTIYSGKPLASIDAPDALDAPDAPDAPSDAPCPTDVPCPPDDPCPPDAPCPPPITYLGDLIGGVDNFLVTGFPVFFVLGATHSRVQGLQVDAGNVNRRPNRNCESKEVYA